MPRRCQVVIIPEDKDHAAFARGYKRWQARNGASLPHEDRMDPFQLGQVVARLNPAAPPVGLPPALEAILAPWGEFVRWART
ncbi:MAG: hypothetical protein HS113_12045 [Verrucomicrobiales bacterium]|nr:hypothetical protein [Verrucomicrobiales bacterium]